MVKEIYTNSSSFSPPHHDIICFSLDIHIFFDQLYYSGYEHLCFSNRKLSVVGMLRFIHSLCLSVLKENLH